MLVSVLGKIGALGKYTLLHLVLPMVGSQYLGLHSRAADRVEFRVFAF